MAKPSQTEVKAFLQKLRRATLALRKATAQYDELLDQAEHTAKRRQHVKS